MKQTTIYTFLADSYMVGIMTVVTLVLCVVSSNILVFSIFFFYFLMVAFARMYIRFASRIRWEFRQDGKNMFIGETNMCTVHILNPSVFPMLRVVFRFTCDPKLSWHHDKLNKNKSTGSHYDMTFHIKGEETLTFDLQGMAKQRGIAKWNEVEIIISDPFRLITKHIIYQQCEMPLFSVLPLVPNIQVPELQEWSLGFRKAMSAPLYDETKVMGIKSYEHEDFRSIHWGATAKTGVITAKKYERTQSDKYAIYVNLLNKNGISIRHDVEELIEVAAGVCKQLLLQDCSFELWLNCMKENGILHIKNGNSRKHLQRTLELLANVNEHDLPVSSFYFYKAGFHQKEIDAIPLIIGTAPKRNSRSDKWIVIKE